MALNTVFISYSSLHPAISAAYRTFSALYGFYVECSDLNTYAYPINTTILSIKLIAQR